MSMRSLLQILLSAAVVAHLGGVVFFLGRELYLKLRAARPAAAPEDELAPRRRRRQAQPSEAALSLAERAESVR